MSFVSSLQRGTIHRGRDGRLYASGWYDEAVWLAATSREDYAADQLAGANILVKVCDAVLDPGGDDEPPEEPPYSTVAERDDGTLVVAVHRDDVRVYACRNFADGFTEVGV